MSLAKTLAQLEERYYDELEEDRNAVIAELSVLHVAALKKSIEEFRAFSKEAMAICGGVYIPYVMWVELAQFIEHHNNREQLFGIMQAFVDRDSKKRNARR